MEKVEITDLPEDVFALLKKRAKLADMTVSNYLRELVVAQMRTPSTADLIAQARENIPSDRDITIQDVRDAIEDGRRTW